MAGLRRLGFGVRPEAALACHKLTPVSPEVSLPIGSHYVSAGVRTVLHPQGVKGPWKAGIVLDWHTIGSQLIGENELEHLIFETQRSEIGELLYQLKYRNDRAALAKMLSLSIAYLAERVHGRFDIILPARFALKSGTDGDETHC